MSAPVDAAAAPYEAPAGLAGVSVARTKVSDVLGRQGFYHYRGYNAVDIARRGRVEDAWHLMLHGELPTPEQRADFTARAAAWRELPEGVAGLLPAIARLSPPGSLSSLRTAISLAAQALGCRPWGDQTQAETGEEPGDRSRYAIERYLMLTIDHGFNNSTFTARVIASSGADLGAVVTGALAALSGPLHGGAPARVFDMLDAIGTPDNAEPWLRHEIESGHVLMGFGHRIYKTIDPRSQLLHEVARELHSDRVVLSEVVEKTAVQLLAELKPGRDLYANVEFYAGVVLEAAGLPREMFTPSFACSRIIGWIANVLEQISDNRIFRPLAHYDGPAAPRDLPGFWHPGTP